MSIEIYGIPNCDTVKKARAWLGARGIGYTFHDYKKEGADPAKLAAWSDAVGWEALLNRRGTTFRALSDADKTEIDRAKAKMSAIVARPLPGATAEIIFEPGDYPPMSPTEGNRALLTRLNAVNRDLGLEEMGELDPVKRGAGDISFVAADVDSLAGMGPASRGDHAPGETVDIGSIARQAKRAAILMTRLSRERRGR